MDTSEMRKKAKKIFSDFQIIVFKILKYLKFDVDLGNAKKNSENLFGFLHNCI